jgi:hypothetical protein
MLPGRQEYVVVNCVCLVVLCVAFNVRVCLLLLPGGQIYVVVDPVGLAILCVDLSINVCLLLLPGRQRYVVVIFMRLVFLCVVFSFRVCLPGAHRALVIEAVWLFVVRVFCCLAVYRLDNLALITRTNKSQFPCASRSNCASLDTNITGELSTLLR